MCTKAYFCNTCAPSADLVQLACPQAVQSSLRSACISKLFDQSLLPTEWPAKLGKNYVDTQAGLRLGMMFMRKGTFNHIVGDINSILIGLDKSGYQINIFLISPRKHVSSH